MIPCQEEKSIPTKEEPHQNNKNDELAKDIQTPSSCISSHLEDKDSESKEENILDDPFVKRATELFTPKKITIRRKV